MTGEVVGRAPVARYVHVDHGDELVKQALGSVLATPNGPQEPAIILRSPENHIPFEPLDVFVRLLQMTEDVTTASISPAFVMTSPLVTTV